VIIVPADRLGRQIAAIFRAWGMPEEQIEVTVGIMLEADLTGIDSHGAAMLQLYDQQRAAGKIEMNPVVRVVRDGPTTALVDGGGGLGHYPSSIAMDLAIRKAKETGVGVVTVRRSNHYGAAGVYARRAAEQGLIGMSTTNVHTPSVVPTFSSVSMFGTNPIAFAAPTRRNPPYVFDMATSTAALGKFKLAAMAGKSLPEGWAVDEAGAPVTDPKQGIRQRRLTPLGVSREMGGHKGYGLAMMVEILSATLPGAAFAPVRNARDPGAAKFNVGHFFLALDPTCFRDEGEFEDDLDDMIDALHAAPPVAPNQPVLVAGDPEHVMRARREAEGIPLPDDLVGDIRTICAAAGAEFLLGAAPGSTTE
jgi:LDH2 family malate/lactate/ureidoglycolate dehydrogenase